MKVFPGKIIVPAALAILAFWRLVAGRDGHAPSSTEIVRHPQDPVIKADLPSAMSSRWARPIFSRPTSAKPIEVDASKTTEENAAQAFRLVGVVADGENRLAILEVKGRLVRSKAGMTVGSWKIVEIEPRSIILESSGETKVLNVGQK